MNEADKATSRFERVAALVQSDASLQTAKQRRWLPFAAFSLLLLAGLLTFWLMSSASAAEQLAGTGTAQSLPPVAAATETLAAEAIVPPSLPPVLPTKPPTKPPSPLPSDSPTTAPATPEQATPTLAVVMVVLPTLTPLPASPTPLPYVDPLTGLAATEEQVNQRPIVAMIDNHWDAAPQSGLDHAAVVYEGMAEGGITRFEAIFTGASGEVAEIGPMRSARSYFVDWALPFRPLYAHAGGSPVALERLADPNVGLLNLDLLTAGPSWRSTDRLAPHNLYTDSSSLHKYLAASQLDQFKIEAASLPHKDEQPPSSPPLSTTISYTFSDLSRSDEAWHYDRASNSYLRDEWGGPHTDLISGAQLRAKNVAFVFVSVAPVIGDDKARVEVGTVGSGDALFALDGQLRPGHWQKDAVDGPIILTYADGSPVSFNRGNTWFEMLPTDRQISFK